jgi:DNA-binding beta-propeller fold protein YncE
MPSLQLVVSWELSLSIGGVAFSPDGRRVIVGEDERIRAFDIVGKREVARINQLGPERSFFQAMAALPNGFVTVDDQGYVLVGDLAANAFIAKGDDPPPKAESVAVSPDRARAYVGNGYGEILVYDVSGLT